MRRIKYFKLFRQVRAGSMLKVLAALMKCIPKNTVRYLAWSRNTLIEKTSLPRAKSFYPNKRAKLMSFKKNTKIL